VMHTFVFRFLFCSTQAQHRKQGKYATKSDGQ
jgi:hypothetical protein